MPKLPRSPNIVILAVTLLALVACTRHPAAQGPTARVTAPSSTDGADPRPTPPLPPERQAANAYVQATNDSFEVLTRPPARSINALDPQLTGRALVGTRLKLVDFDRRNVVVRRRNGRTPTVIVRRAVVSGPGHVLVDACDLDDSVQVQLPTGVVIDDAVVSRLYRADVTLDGALWKIAHNELVNEWPDLNGCDR